MQRDFALQRRVELEQISGTVVRQGARLGVPTPGFHTLYAVLKAQALAFGGIPSD